MVKKDKNKALELLKGKVNGDNVLSYRDIELRIGFSKRHLIRWFKELKEKDIDEISTHGNKGRKPVNAINDTEINYIIDFKRQYPKITITQFMDIYHEDIILNKDKVEDVKNYGLEEHSYSFYRSLFIKYGWISPIRRKRRKNDKREHLLREPSPRRGTLIQIDATPFDWFNDGRMYAMHLLIDDATSEIISGFFTPNECQFGYCKCILSMINDYGIPLAIYSDRHTIFKNLKDGSVTQFGMIMEDLGIEMIFAQSSEAKGRVERSNYTIQNRLPNDIIRYGIKDYDELNIWFNDFYKSYLNSKFAYRPKDPNDEFVTIDDSFDYRNYFYLRKEKTIYKNSFRDNHYDWSAIDENGELLKLRNKTKVLVCTDVFTGESWIERYGRRFYCQIIHDAKRERLAANQKDLISEIENIGSNSLVTKSQNKGGDKIVQ